MPACTCRSTTKPSHILYQSHMSHGAGLPMPVAHGSDTSAVIAPPYFRASAKRAKSSAEMRHAVGCRAVTRDGSVASVMLCTKPSPTPVAAPTDAVVFTSAHVVPAAMFEHAEAPGVRPVTGTENVPKPVAGSTATTRARYADPGARCCTTTLRAVPLTVRWPAERSSPALVRITHQRLGDVDDVQLTLSEVGDAADTLTTGAPGRPALALPE